MTLTQQQQQQVMNTSKKLQLHQQQSINHTYQLRSTTMKTTTTTLTVTTSMPTNKKTSPAGLKKACGLFNPEHISITDTGTKDNSDLNKTTNETISFFDNIDVKLSEMDDDFFINNNNNNNNINGENSNNIVDLNVQSQYPLTTSTSLNNDELNFEDINITEIMNSDSNNNNNQVFSIKSNLMKRVENKNMKIKMPLDRQESFNIPLDDDLRNLLTPTITNAYHDFMKSLPTPQIQSSNNHIDTNDLILELQNLETPLIPKTTSSQTRSFSNERNPFLTSFSAEVKLNEQPQVQQIILEQVEIDETCTFAIESPIKQHQHQTLKQLSVDSVNLDHDYTISPKKRKLSIEDESNSVFNFDASLASTTTTTTATTATPFKRFQRASTSSTTSSFATANDNTTSNSKQGKRKRVKGIYRANDVTTKEELENYIERRRKNNISSKQSRLTKKKLYLNMDDQSDQLEKDNDRLKQQIGHLESLTKLLKDVLLQRFTSNIK